MRILVVGAYGLIGGYVTSRLLRDGHEVLGSGRDTRRAARRFPQVEWVNADLAKTAPQRWAELLVGVDSVVNCAGALQDSARDDLTAVHAEGPRVLAQACVEAGVRRFVQVSAAGIENGRDRFSGTKREFDSELRRLDLDWMILRPGLVLAPAAYGGSALLRGLAGLPLLIPAVHANSVVQVVSVLDVAEAVARAVRPDNRAKFTVDLVAPERTTLGEILLKMRGWLGFPPAPLIALPPIVAKPCTTIADALAWLGWRSPMRTTAIRQLAQGVRGNAGDGMSRLGFAPRSLDDLFLDHPAGVQERWFARTYFIKPLMLGVLAAFWMISGVIGLNQLSAAAGLLNASGLNESTSETFVVAGSLVDICLGTLVCWRRTAGPALLGMVATTAAYLIGASFLTPHLWADPLGPILKSVPAAFLAVCALAVLDER